MAIQSINIGSIANDGTGDDVREAFNKVNANFLDLDTKVSTADGSDGANLGLGEGLFAQKSDNTLQFRSIVAGSNISLSGGGNSLTISGDASMKQLIVVSDSGSVVLGTGNNTIRIQGGSGTTTRVTSEDVFIDVDGTNLVETDTSPKLGGVLNADGNNIQAAGTVTATSFVGPLTGTVNGIDVSDLDKFVFGFDFDAIIPSATSFSEWFTLNTDVDFGSLTIPNATSVELGAI
jgi:hypothetical protein|tara:strand:+ start:338 stop:1039 length:702 start_codon:yes stop_codon:yes gene_type:complete